MMGASQIDTPHSQPLSLGRGEPELPLLPGEKGGGGMRVNNLYKWNAPVHDSENEEGVANLRCTGLSP